MVSRGRMILATAQILLSQAACSQTETPATQLILVADSDLDRIDTIEFRIEADNVPAKTARAARPVDGSPVYLSLHRDEGPLGPLTITARGLLDSAQVVSRTHVVSFVEQQTRIVPLHLVRSCVNRNCLDQTCTELGCVPRAIDPQALASWSGEPPSLDSGILAQCGNGMVDLTSDPNHCGACGMTCTVPPGTPHTLPACSASSCSTSCEPLWDNCNSNPRDGCERNVSADSKNCGKCGVECSASQKCEAGVCVQK